MFINFVNIMVCRIAGYVMPHGPIRVFVKADVPKELLSLMEEYANMLVEIRLANLPSTNFHRLKMFLSDYCREKKFRDCDSVCEVIDILVEKMKIYIFNIDTLNACYNKNCFDSAEVKVAIEQYKKQLHEFLSATTIQEFKGTLHTKVVNHNIVEHIVLKLEESRTEDTLDNLKTLVQHFFRNCKKELILCDVRPGCVCIMWLAPVSLVPTLKTMVDQHSRTYLTSQGILELVIGLRIAPNEGLHSLMSAVLILFINLNYMYLCRR